MRIKQYYFDINGLKLEDCCIKTIMDIRRKLQLSNFVQILLPISYMAQIFFDPYNTEFKSFVSTNANLTVQKQDWSDLAVLTKSVTAISIIAKNQIVQAGKFEELKHNNKNQYELGKFWNGIWRVFDDNLAS